MKLEFSPYTSAASAPRRAEPRIALAEAEHAEQRSDVNDRQHRRRRRERRETREPVERDVDAVESREELGEVDDRVGREELPRDAQGLALPPVRELVEVDRAVRVAQHLRDEEERARRGDERDALAA